VSSRDLLLSIAEAAQLVGVKPATLRAWERNRLVAPHRTEAGYRRYTLAQIELLRQVRQLREVAGLDLEAIREATAGAPPPATGSPELIEPPSWAPRLRELRRRHGMSLRQAASRTELSPSFISAIERGLANPSVAALKKLTAAYGTSIVELMESKSGSSRLLIRVADRQVYDATPGVRMEQLNHRDHAMGMHLITVDPGRGAGGAFQHEGEEFMFMVSGTLDVWIDGVERFLLQPGDVLYFDSMHPHDWSNPGPAPAVFLDVNTPQSF
jgi:DNA-binding transcriptional MerR regulator/mannose-6-phosphate isomerase-like protein (cupin superfamily)